MPFEDTKIPEFNQYWKCDQNASIVFADLEYLIKKEDVCKDNAEKTSTTNGGEYTPCGYSMLLYGHLMV